MGNKCDKNGRALEFQVVKEIINFANNQKIDLNMSNETQKDNDIDEYHFNSLSNINKLDFNKCSTIFMNWMNKEKWFNGIKEIKIDRIPDSDGIKGDVTDIRLTLLNNDNQLTIKNLSIKNHHNALKHPRLPNFANQCGITDVKILTQYKTEHDKIWADFVKKSYQTKSTAIAFNELNTIDTKFIDKNLYRPLNELVINLILNNLNSDQVKKLFTFLTGKINFYTLKNDKLKIIIKDFSNIPLPTKIQIFYTKDIDNTFLLKFDNKWNITFRIHTCSTNFLKASKLKMEVKYDVVCTNIEDVITIEELIK